jgi:hypothetical protein
MIVGENTKTAGVPQAAAHDQEDLLDSHIPDVDSTPPGVHMPIYIRVRVKGAMDVTPLQADWKDSTYCSVAVNTQPQIRERRRASGAFVARFAELSGLS